MGGAWQRGKLDRRAGRALPVDRPKNNYSYEIKSYQLKLVYPQRPIRHHDYTEKLELSRQASLPARA